MKDYISDFIDDHMLISVALLSTVVIAEFAGTVALCASMHGNISALISLFSGMLVMLWTVVLIIFISD